MFVQWPFVVKKARAFEVSTTNLNEITIKPAGDTAVQVFCGKEISEAVGDKVSALTAALRDFSVAEKIAGIGEVVPAFSSLIVRYDPLVTDYDEVAFRVGRVAADIEISEEGGSRGTIVEIPVCYGGEFGEDLADVAAHNGITEQEVIDIHSGRRLGYVSDAELDDTDGRILSLITPGRARLFGLLGREDDFVFPWGSIRRMGPDIILVDLEQNVSRRKHRRMSLFGEEPGLRK